MKVEVDDEKLIVFMDICSSTKIMEDLNANMDTDIWKFFHSNLFKIINKLNINNFFEIYKFTGDGYIFFFDIKENIGKDILMFLKELCHSFKEEFKSTVDKSINIKIEPLGLTFGISNGLIKKLDIKINDSDEFISCGLNIASRLQNSIKAANNNSDNPAYQVLFLRSTFNKYFNYKELEKDFAYKDVERNMKNISNGIEKKCIRLSLLHEMNNFVKSEKKTDKSSNNEIKK